MPTNKNTWDSDICQYTCEPSACDVDSGKYWDLVDCECKAQIIDPVPIPDPEIFIPKIIVNPKCRVRMDSIELLLDSLNNSTQQ